MAVQCCSATGCVQRASLTAPRTDTDSCEGQALWQYSVVQQLAVCRGLHLQHLLQTLTAVRVRPCGSTVLFSNWLCAEGFTYSTWLVCLPPSSFPPFLLLPPPPPPALPTFSLFFLSLLLLFLFLLLLLFFFFLFFFSSCFSSSSSSFSFVFFLFTLFLRSQTSTASLA